MTAERLAEIRARHDRCMACSAIYEGDLHVGELLDALDALTAEREQLRARLQQILDTRQAHGHEWLYLELRDVLLRMGGRG